MASKKLLLVDGTAVAYRAFYAIAELSTSAGRPTNAVYGFIKMLQQLEELWAPTHHAVVFDGGLPRERLERLPTYKAQRKPMPDALRGQFAPIEDFLGRAGTPSIRIEAEEADDVLATMADRAAREGSDVVIATSDKDLFQLVNERVVMVAPSKAGEPMGPAQVVLKTGVRPEKIVEWLALTGDSVDNIPGVPGVGPKTAAKLLDQFGSLEGLWGAVGEVSSEKLRAALLGHREDVIRNLELVRLRRNLPVALDWDAMRVRPPMPSRLIPFYEEMEFKSLAQSMRKLEGEGPMLDFG